MESNIEVRSNLMIDDADHKLQYRYLPGDFVKLIYPELTDVRTYEGTLTQEQVIELRQYIVCIRCRRPCAGTCG
jgi:hypothetical protein